MYKHGAALSTIASGLAAVAYATCALTEGIGCGVGLGLSSSSTALSGVNTYRACFGGAGECTLAAVGLGTGVLATGSGLYLQGAAERALWGDNAYAIDSFLAAPSGRDWCRR